MSRSTNRAITGGRRRGAARTTVVVVTGMLALSSCSVGSGTGPGGTAQGGPGSLDLGLIQDVQSWDPADAGVGPKLTTHQAVYDTLILRKPDGALAPMLATKWDYTNDTRTRLQLDLRGDVTFSDGTKFDASAAKASLDHFRTANGSQANQLAGVSDVRVVDADTVAIELEEPNPALEYNLSQAAGLMASPKALRSGSVGRTPVGSGPYVMDTARSVTGSQYSFKAREGYWNPELQHWDQITYKVLSDPTARVNALVSGQVDATSLEARTVAQAKGAGKTVLNWDAQFMGLLLFDRDGKVNPALRDERVRQAINYAFDKETILKESQGGFGEPTGQVFSKTSTAYVAELDNAYPYDPDRARRLLAEAGYPNGFTLTIPLAAPLEHLLPFITQPLKDVGITVKTSPVPVQNYQAELGSGKYAAGWWVVGQGPTWVVVQRLIAAKTLYNPFGSTDPELQRMLDAVKAGGPDAEQQAQEMNRYITEKAWFAPWFRVHAIFGIDPTVVKAEPQVDQGVPSLYNYTPAG